MARICLQHTPKSQLLWGLVSTGFGLAWLGSVSWLVTGLAGLLLVLDCLAASTRTKTMRGCSSKLAKLADKSTKSDTYFKTCFKAIHGELFYPLIYFFLWVKFRIRYNRKSINYCTLNVFNNIYEEQFFLLSLNFPFIKIYLH